MCSTDFDIEKCFLRDDVQRILKRITGFDLDKIFRVRRIDDLKPPRYKLLTTEQLEKVHDMFTVQAACIDSCIYDSNVTLSKMI